MKRFVPVFLLALTGVCGSANAAGNAHGVAVVNVDARSDGSFLVTFSGAITTPPSCATELKRMAGDANTPGGRAVLAAAMLAYSTGSTVSAQGTGACSMYSGIESILILAQSR